MGQKISYTFEFYIIKLLALFLISYERNAYEVDTFPWKQHTISLRTYLTYIESMFNIYVLWSWLLVYKSCW